MAVAMAACNVALLNLRAADNIFSAPIFNLKASCGSAATNSCYILHKRRLTFSGTTIISRAATVTDVEDGDQGEIDTVPTPKVIIDQDSDPDATVVDITFGDRLGALLDTMNTLQNLGLNVFRANVFLDSSGKHNKFFISKSWSFVCSDTGRKVEEPELLDAIRLTIINNLIQYHPVLINILRYFLRRPTTEESSF